MTKHRTNEDGLPILAASGGVFSYDKEAASQSITAAQRVYEERSQNNFLTFTRGLKIEVAGRKRVFDTCMAPFQRDCFEDLAPTMHALRKGKMPTHRRFWVERTKKASKDADMAVVVLWLIAFAERPFYAQIGAADREQAAIIKERVGHMLEFNPWLNDHVEVVQWQIRSKTAMANGSPMAKLDIMAADISGAHGGTPDLLIINELTHVSKWEFVENLFDNADGVPHGVVIIATNAGIKGTPAEKWRKNAIASEAWETHVLAQPAPWHSEKTLKDAETRNPPSRHKRLWRGVWVSGKGDALDESDINAIFKLPGPTLTREPGFWYLIGLDIGITHDHSGMVVVGVNPDARQIKLAQMQAWEPMPNTGEVDLIAVETAVLAMSRHYGATVVYDPHQAKRIAQGLTRAGVRCREMTFHGRSLDAMANAFVQVVKRKELACYDDAEGRLRRDIGKFFIVEKSYGLRLEAVSDEYGHADVGTALVITLPVALDLMQGGVGVLNPDDELVYESEQEITPEEQDALPDEFKELFAMEDEMRENQRLYAVSRDPFDGF